MLGSGIFGSVVSQSAIGEQNCLKGHASLVVETKPRQKCDCESQRNRRHPIDRKSWRHRRALNCEGHKKDTILWGLRVGSWQHVKAVAVR